MSAVTVLVRPFALPPNELAELSGFDHAGEDEGGAVEEYREGAAGGNCGDRGEVHPRNAPQEPTHQHGTAANSPDWQARGDLGKDHNERRGKKNQPKRGPNNPGSACAEYSKPPNEQRCDEAASNGRPHGHFCGL